MPQRGLTFDGEDSIARGQWSSGVLPVTQGPALRFVTRQHLSTPCFQISLR